MPPPVTVRTPRAWTVTATLPLPAAVEGLPDFGASTVVSTPRSNAFEEYASHGCPVG